jgi:hypothetical protein
MLIASLYPWDERFLYTTPGCLAPCVATTSGIRLHVTEARSEVDNSKLDGLV